MMRWCQSSWSYAPLNLNKQKYASTRSDVIEKMVMTMIYKYNDDDYNDYDDNDIIYNIDEQDADMGTHTQKCPHMAHAFWRYFEALFWRRFFESTP